MEEKTVKEIEAGAKILGLTTEEANAKFAEICSESHIETNNPIGLGLWRNYVANAKRSASSGKQQQSDSLFKPAFGFFLSLDAPRDMMSWNRNKAKEEYLRDSESAVEKGIVAVAVENALGKFTVSRYFNGNYEEKVVGTLPEGAETLEDGRIYIPLDSTATFTRFPRFPAQGRNQNQSKSFSTGWADSTGEPTRSTQSTPATLIVVGSASPSTILWLVRPITITVEPIPKSKSMCSGIQQVVILSDSKSTSAFKSVMLIIRFPFLVGVIFMLHTVPSVMMKRSLDGLL